MRDPIVNQSEFSRLNWFSSTSGSSLQGCGLSHSYGLNLQINMDTYLGRKSQPCCMSEPMANHMQFRRVNWFSK